MFVDSISINNFRNLKNVNLKLSKKINFIIGKNAQGKTNFIESIYFTAFLKSFRVQKKFDLINYREDFSLIDLEVNKQDVKNKIKLKITKKELILKVNNKKDDIFNFLNVIIFHPDEINYINNYPVFRRNLIDRSIFYNDYDYINLYKKYTRCLKQRNIFLKEGHSSKDIWIDQLVKYGSEIIKKRINYLDKINTYFSSENFKTKNQENYFIYYPEKYSKSASIVNSLYEEFELKNKRERLLGYTLAGPHKDDVVFYLNGRPAESFASQGQKRSLLISYKTAQILDYKAVHGHYPVLILDDMISELDSGRKSVLLENLIENSGQVFITSTDLKQLNIFDQTKVFKVNNGEVSVAD